VSADAPAAGRGAERMRAVRVARFGGPEELEVAEVPIPEPDDDEVLVEVEAAGVNRLDLLTRGGGYHRAGRPPLVLGQEGAGRVRAVGGGVRGLAPGDPVIAFGGRPGFYAEVVAVPAARVVRRPEALDPTAAAALPTAWLTAWACLHRLARVGPGDVVLVLAAASGVGDAAVQLARRAGARVIGVAGGAEKGAWVRANGADATIDHTTEDVVERVAALTEGAGADVVLDAVGGPAFAQALRAARHGARVVALANVALQPSLVDVRDFYPKNVTIHGFQITNLIERGGYDPRDDLLRLAALVAGGDVTVHVDRTLPLDQAAEAHRHLERRANRGKVVLVPRARA